jgi:NTE family protein
MNETTPERSLAAGGDDRLRVCDDHWHWPRRPGTKRINLALQGGGAHGAFAWGVLDRLLEDDRIEIEAISGTSAGAMNAAVAAEGLMKGGPEHARMRLEEFWRRISVEALSSPVRRSFLDMLFTRWSLDHNPALTFFGAVTGVPPISSTLHTTAARRSPAGWISPRSARLLPAVHLATNVLTGRVRFTGPEVPQTP